MTKINTTTKLQSVLIPVPEAAILKNCSILCKSSRPTSLPVEILFVSAEINTLLKRFSETRRKHPLTTDDIPLIKAIHLERELLSEIADHADLTIDTTKTNVRQLRALVNRVVIANDEPGLTLVLQSFGFKHGIPNDSDFYVRCALPAQSVLATQFA